MSSVHSSATAIVQASWLLDALLADEDGASPQARLALLERSAARRPAPGAAPLRVFFLLDCADDILTTPAILDILSLEGLSPELHLVLPDRPAVAIAARALGASAGFLRVHARGAVAAALHADTTRPVVFVPARTALDPRLAAWIGDFVRNGAAAVSAPPLSAGPAGAEIVALRGAALAGLLSGAGGLGAGDRAVASVSFAGIADLQRALSALSEDSEPRPHGARDAAVAALAADGAASPFPGDPVWHFEGGAVRVDLPAGTPPAERAAIAIGLGDGARILAREERPSATVRATLPLSAISRKPVDVALALESAGAVAVAGHAAPYPPERLTPDMLTCFLNRGGAGNPVIEAFATGVGAGMRYAEDETGPCPGVPLVWGVLRGSDRVIALAEANRQYWFYTDHAYFARGHGKNYRISRNAYEAGRIRECPTDRVADLGVTLAPWNRDGSIVLVCPPTEYFMVAHKCETWLADTLAHLARVTDRPVVVRDKPKPGETSEPLVEVLKRTHALVTHSSNVAVEAAVLGTPVFVAPTSAAAPIGRTSLDEIERPAYPDREAWLAHLSHSQFGFEEIASGAAWRMLLEFEQRPFVDGAP